MVITHFLSCFFLFIQATIPAPGGGANSTPDGVLSGGQPTPLYPLNPSSSTDFLSLLVSAGVLVLNIFILYQAVSFQQWFTKDEKNAPNSYAGVGFICVFTIIVTIAWVAYQKMLLKKTFGIEEGDLIVSYFLDYPKKLAPPLWLSSCVIGFISMFKFAITWSFFRSTKSQDSESSRTPITAIIGAIFAAAGFVASIVKIIEFFRS